MMRKCTKIILILIHAIIILIFVNANYLLLYDACNSSSLSLFLLNSSSSKNFSCYLLVFADRRLSLDCSLRQKACSTVELLLASIQLVD